MGPVAEEGFDCLTLLTAVLLHGFLRLLTVTLQPFMKSTLVHFASVEPQCIGKLSAGFPAGRALDPVPDCLTRLWLLTASPGNILQVCHQHEAW